MVKNSIKVYARIKKENITKRVKLENYIISKSDKDFDDLIFHHCNSDVRFSYYQFRYHKVFDQLSSQKEIFEIVAKPVVSSVIHGFNGTIFAYGQTGSGKTYSITGCPKTYENRGIIPRCLEHIFEYLNQNPEAFTIHLSYLEIYNEIGYDLLNPKQIASKLEEFPRVILLEDAKGEAHLRNLSVHAVSTEKDAMRLLFLGDTNRTIAETPMNDYSSRSHCIFTIYLTNQLKTNNKTVRSKLHIVDLAGSERIGKSTITGNTLNEAKNINLSLHYLEQVIAALSSSKKHIPFRNSMLTYLLKDSLCGNSLTTMLATLAVTKKNIEETISTCRFSKRVSMITTQPIINEVECDSQQEINILQNEIYELKSKLLKYEGDFKLNHHYKHYSLEGEEKLNAEKREHYKNLLDDFLNFKLNVIDLTLSEMKFCMEVMRDMCQNQLSPRCISDVGFVDADLKATSKQKEDEIPLKILPQSEKTLSFPMKQSDLNPINRNENKQIGYAETPRSSSSRYSRADYNEKVEEYHDKLKHTYEEAKAKAEIIERCRQNIIILRTKMDQHRNVKIKEKLVAELYHQQDIYRKTILELRTLEKKTNHLKLGLLQAEMKRRRRDDLSPSVTSSDSVWLNNNDGYEPNIHLSIPQFSSESHNKSSENWYSDTNYFFDDYNRPEKENEGTQTMLTSRNEDGCISPEYPKLTGGSPSFLKLLADNNCTLANDELGPPLEKQGPINSNWYSEYHKNNDSTVSRTSEYWNIRRNANKPLKECPVNLIDSWNPIQEDVMNQKNYQVMPKSVTNKPQRKRVAAEFKMESKHQAGYPVNFSFDQTSAINGEIKEESTLDFSPRNRTNQIPYDETDSAEFKEFIKSVPLTGDNEVDEEILNFYRTKFKK